MVVNETLGVSVNVVKCLCQYIQHCNTADVIPYICYILPTIWRMRIGKYWANIALLFEPHSYRCEESQSNHRVNGTFLHPLRYLNIVLFFIQSFSKATFRKECFNLVSVSQKGQGSYGSFALSNKKNSTTLWQIR